MLAPILAIVATVFSCTDIREFRGTWVGDRVGEAAVLRAGFAEQASATLVVESIDLANFDGVLSTSDGVFTDSAVTPLAAAEADVLANISFDGAPARVFVSFAETADGGGPATLLVALYDDDRIEVRAMRGGSQPLYGIFVLRQ